MSAYREFQQWLVIDWAGAGANTWVRSGEEAKQFLFVTPTERKWESCASSLGLPTSEFVLIMFLTSNTPLDERVFNAKLLVPASGTLPIWCHYGGNVSTRELGNEWRRGNRLGEALQDELTKRLPPPNLYPMPFSNHLDFGWQREWTEIKNIIRSYESKAWHQLIANLNGAWKKASKEIGINAVKLTLTSWLGARNAFDRLLWLLPENGEITKEQLATVLQDARELHLRRLRPGGFGYGPHTNEHGKEINTSIEFSLSTAFEEVLNATFSLMLRKGNELDLMRNDVRALRTALLSFREAYDEKVSLANSRD